MSQQKVIYKRALAERIRRLCVEKGISITSIESEVGYSQGMISRWMSADIGEDFSVLTKLSAMADCFGITMDELLGRGQTEPSPMLSESCDFTNCLLNATKCGKLTWRRLNVSNDTRILLEQVPAPKSSQSIADMWIAEQDRISFLLILWRNDIDNTIEFELYAFVGHSIPPYALHIDEKRELQELYTYLRIQCAYQSIKAGTTSKQVIKLPIWHIDKENFTIPVLRSPIRGYQKPFLRSLSVFTSSS